jgi:HPt (histidine-containing phosphotransfer) domain-containing protein
MLNAIREAVAQKNPAALHSAAHALKGSISTFGAARVCNSALKLESMGRNANLGEAEQELEILNREIESFVPALTELRKEMLSEDPGRG